MSPWIPKNQSVCEIKSNNINDGNDSVAESNGVIIFVKRAFKPNPATDWHRASNNKKPTKLIVNGIKILNGAATLGGTASGILIETSCLIQKLIISTTINETIIALNIDPAPNPDNGIALPASVVFIGAPAIIKKTTVAETQLSILGILYLSANRKATAPAKYIEIEPIVKRYG